MKYLLTFMLFVIALTMTVQAQTVITTVQTPVVTTTVQMPPPPKAPKAATEIIATISTKVVKDAPFSAEGISESIQILADGNKITRSVTTKMFRDGEGRFRREGSGGGVGNGGTITPMPYGTFTMFYGFDAITIFDPVAGIRYSLNPKDKTARSSNVKDTLNVMGTYVSGTMMPTDKAQIESKVIALSKADAQAKPNVAIATGNGYSYSNDSKTESLGTKTFEGVETEGSRTVTTIPAGAIGNERAIEIVYERWFSKDLDLIVYSRHYDPRFGEQIYRLTNIDRGEPDRSLFTVPSDYKISVESGMRIFTTTTAPTPPPSKQQ